MRKRLEIRIADDELWAIQDAARRRHLTTAAWVRDALQRARREAGLSEVARKRHAITIAADHAFPVGNVDAMLVEIERGYGDDAVDGLSRLG